MENSNSSTQQLTAVEFDPFAAPELSGTAPSTESQRELWAGAQMGDDASAAFNESVSLSFEGELDRAAFLAAIQDLVARHEALRTTFSPDGLTLCIAAELKLEPTLTDLRECDARDRTSRLRALRDTEVQLPFSLEHGPLFRVQLIVLGEREHAVIFTAHHIVCDGWSMAVMLKDLGALYSARRSGRQVELEPAPRFSDYARAERDFEQSAEYAKSMGYWLGQLQPAPSVLELPLDAARPPSRTYASMRVDYELDKALVERVKKVGAKNRASFFTTMLASFHALLSRLSGQTEIVVGIPAAGQSITGQSNLVGHCVNTLPLRLQAEPETLVSELLRTVRTTMLDAYEHQRCTFGGILKRLQLPRDPSRLPLVSVLFNVDQAVRGDELGFADLNVRFQSNPRSFENFEIFINAAETPAGVVLECQFNVDLFSEDTIRRWLSAYEELLRGLAEGQDRPIGQISILPERERAQLLYEWNATFVDYDRSATAHALIEAQASRTPDAIALVFNDEQVSYAELDRRANQLAHRLRREGVQRDVLVGLCLQRSVDMVVALLAVLKAGGAYVPLDPGFPRDRLVFMLEDARIGLLLTESALQTQLGLSAATTLRLDLDKAALAAESEAPLARAAASDPTAQSLAYVIYTSGSTGKPKGVCVPHGSVVNFVTSMLREPGVSADDVVVAVTTLSFDIAVLELYAPLSAGARVVIASREVASDGALLKALLEREGATLMQATPSTWRLLLAAGFAGGPNFRMLCGGEALPRDLAQELTRRSESLWNMYGPTETTVWSTCYKVPKNSSRILIGKPIANTAIYVLDAHLQPVPVGVPGELHIGGDGVTRGYLARAELTSERFVRDPFASDAQARLYKTGDIVRLLGDGNLEYIRRNDHQVKLRGYRIELGEIESALASVPAVKQAVAAVLELRGGDSRLVGYVVTDPEQTTPSEATLRGHMRAFVPEYMIPQHFVYLAGFTLTPNGKIDRKALPKPELGSASGGAPFVAPRNADEAAVIQVLEEYLGVTQLSIDANFFDVGGHSVLAAQILSRLQRDLGVMIPLRKFFESPSAAGLAAVITAGRAVETSPSIPQIGRRSGTGPAPLSLMQRRLWVLEQLDPGLAVQNLPSAFRIRGKLDVTLFERALNEVARRHETLRTVLLEVDGEAFQQVQPELTIALEPVEDLSQLAASEREPKLVTLLRDEASRTLDLARGPLVSWRLFRLSPDEHVFFWMAHHIVWDGWSFDIFLHELDALYGAFVRGEQAQLEPVLVRYQDFAAWHREWMEGPELARQSEYWKKQLGGQLPVLDMPTDRPRPAAMTYRGATEPFTLSKAEIEALVSVGRRSGATLYMVLLAGFQTLLSRYSGQEDILIGTPTRGRTLPETQDQIGFFVNTLVFRTDLSGDPSFVDLLARVRAVALDVYAHQEMPFEHLLHDLTLPRDPSRTPIFQAFFTYQDVSNRASRFGDLDYSQVHVHAPVAMTDLYLWVKETGNGLTGGIDYSTDLFDAATMQRFLKQFRQLLASIVEDPTKTVRHINILPEAERRAILSVNDTAVTFPAALGVHQLFERHAASAPAREALIFGSQRVSYGQLDARAEALSQRLRERGAGPHSLVGLYLERSPDMVAALLAVLKTGAGYVPLDPGFPADRLEFMIADAQLSTIVTQRRLVPQLPPHKAVVLVADDDDGTQAAPAPSPALTDFRDATAYVIYTSGSTGKPKGVMVPHAAVVNFLASVAKTPGIGADHTLLAVTTLSFDIAVLELLGPLSVGGRVLLASQEMASDGQLLRSAIDEHGVSIMQATPATWRLLIGAGFERRANFTMLCGGEALPLDLARELVERGGSLWNMYGPTETTVWSTTYRVREPVERVLIGRPLDNTRVYVADAHGELCPLGVPGELLLGGAGVTKGYLHRAELTSQRFHADHWVEGARVYRTGDIVRLLADGNLEYQRRNDHQVKVRGYRIETGEIETALLTHGSVDQAIVLAREDRPGDVRLVAYLRKNDDATDSDLRKHLRGFLPDYMVPHLFVEVAEFPLTPNGKVNRQALPAPDADTSDRRELVEPKTPAEIALAALWRKHLGVERVSARDNFFEIGGHSLLALKVLSEVATQFGVRLGPRTMLLNTLEQVASLLPEPGEPGEHAGPHGDPSETGVKAPKSEPEHVRMAKSLFQNVKKRLFDRG